ncbi:MAG: NAD(+) synthase, partial [Polyangiaceae bacterium]|nr:NAD(+) synthase [Polyangiaceae bacterium]
MSSPSLQSHIGQRLHVSAEIDPAKTAQLIVDFLQQYLDYAGAAGYVLGVSGGQDSTLCARLAQMAVEAYTRHTGKSTALWAMRLPCGVQSDEADALLALDFIRPTRVVVWNIQEAVEASARAFEKATGTCISDYHKGNIKARERMIAQYAVAGQHGLLVLGTDHAAEAVTGFFTKHGDGA